MGKSKNTTQTSSTTRNQLPAYMRQGSERAVGMATARTNQAYEGYGGQRIAEMSGNERTGIDMAASEAGRYDQDFQSARDSLDSSGGSFTDEGIAEKYMNPYMEQVLAPQRRRQNEAFDAERARRQQDAGMQGAFGGRNQMWNNKFEEDFQQSQTDLTGEAYGAAFKDAQNLYGTERDRDITRAGAYSDVAQQQSTQNRNALRDLMATGITERTRDQADLDFKYLEHLEARDWDVSNLNTLVQTLAGVPHESSQSSDSTTTETKKANPMKAIAGIALIAGAAIMTGGASLAMPQIWAAGAGLAGGGDD